MFITIIYLSFSLSLFISSDYDKNRFKYKSRDIVTQTKMIWFRKKLIYELAFQIKYDHFIIHTGR